LGFNSERSQLGNQSLGLLLGLFGLLLGLDSGLIESWDPISLWAKVA
jgi:hypothetical protein